KLAMLEVHRRLGGTSARMLLQVHDELVLEAPVDRLDAVKDSVRGAMEHVFPLRVPLRVDVRDGANWAEAHSTGAASAPPAADEYGHGSPVSFHAGVQWLLATGSSSSARGRAIATPSASWSSATSARSLRSWSACCATATTHSTSCRRPSPRPMRTWIASR